MAKWAPFLWVLVMKKISFCIILFFGLIIGVASSFIELHFVLLMSLVLGVVGMALIKFIGRKLYSD